MKNCSTKTLQKIVFFISILLGFSSMKVIYYIRNDPDILFVKTYFRAIQELAFSLLQQCCIGITVWLKKNPNVSYIIVATFGYALTEPLNVSLEINC